MANHQTFGRRINPQAQPAPARTEPVAAHLNTLFGGTPAESLTPMTAESEPSFADPELEAWKRARGSKFRMPWSQLSLMASLCFGIASFVLPDSVNENVDWLLWGLTAMCAVAWFTNRRKKKLRDSAAP